MISFEWLFLLAFVFVCLGLLLGVLAVFQIMASRGRLRGYGPAILAIGFSAIALVGLFTLVFMKSGFDHTSSIGSTPVERPRNKSIPEGYTRLWNELPPREWFQGQFSARQIQGPASGRSSERAEDGQVLEGIVHTASFRGFEAARVLELTVRDQLERETGALVRIWFAALDSDAQPQNVGNSLRMPGSFVMTRGRVILGIRGPKDLVTRLADHYRQRMNDIPRNLME